MSLNFRPSLCLVEHCEASANKTVCKKSAISSCCIMLKTAKKSCIITKEWKGKIPVQLSFFIKFNVWFPLNQPGTALEGLIKFLKIWRWQIIPDGQKGCHMKHYKCMKNTFSSQIVKHAPKSLQHSCHLSDLCSHLFSMHSPVQRRGEGHTTYLYFFHNRNGYAAYKQKQLCHCGSVAARIGHIYGSKFFHIQMQSSRLCPVTSWWWWFCIAYYDTYFASKIIISHRNRYIA